MGTKRDRQEARPSSVDQQQSALSPKHREITKKQQSRRLGRQQWGQSEIDKKRDRQEARQSSIDQQHYLRRDCFYYSPSNTQTVSTDTGNDNEKEADERKDVGAVEELIVIASSWVCMVKQSKL